VRVLPMAGPDSVTILRAEYSRKTKQLLVEATSSQAGAVLTLEGYGAMTFSGDSSSYIFDSEVKNLRNGDRMRVTSSYGGEDTFPVTFQ
jgi:hypothetical protein